ncbi:hypothetical protein [Mucilaginibacter psychrotolerans]|uniref:Uncharacterized protein n=1 Tax=Mucilaginibacter psychrotolerans TaxID=1524096 RepID=A0A4Y8SHI3_9SPHI|nr:hypothetical protein [Mucilaginibacter psychrotolerans]TFF37924.1 hypothetical protein E2R66_10060 [Mucilaginibacter psychrotolerans]
MKEETNGTATTTFPSEAEMNGMHQNAWLDFQADAQEAKQGVDARYARMVDRFGSYGKMPKGIKEMLKDDYAAHKEKWGENGEEQQKRFGANEPDSTKPQQDKSQPEQEHKSLADEKEAFLSKLQQTREQQTRGMEMEV